jgi:hypothetical protein
MKRIKSIIFPLSIILLVTGWSTFDSSLLTERRAQVDIVTNAPLPTVQQPLRPLSLSLEPRFISSVVHLPGNEHSRQHYVDRENVISDSPLRAFKYALGQFTADY